MSTRLLTGDQFHEATTSRLSTAKSSVRLLTYAITGSIQRSPKFWRDYWELLHSLPQKKIECRAIFTTKSHSGASPPVCWRALASLQTAGWQVRRTAPYSVLHSKLLLIDGHCLFIGSHNQTMAAASENIEASIFTDDATTVHDASKFFRFLWDKSS